MNLMTIESLMRTIRNSSSILLILALAAVVTSSCAGLSPSQPIIKEIKTLKTTAVIPQTVNVKSITVDGVPRLSLDIQEYMKSVLISRGFILEKQNPEAVFVGHARWSSHAISGTDITLHMALEQTESGSVIWDCEIQRDYDIYSSLTDGIKQSIYKAIDCLLMNTRSLRE